MPIEIEKKFRLTPPQFEAMRQRLEDAGAKFEGSSFESNQLFSDDSLRERAAYIRLRYTDAGTMLTFKRNLSPGSELKTQMEIESEIGDPEAVISILNELGLRLVILYEKERDFWKLGDAEVVLDRLPFGLYMEIEGTVEAIESAEKQVVTGEIASEVASYPRLTAEFGTHNDGVASAVFADRKQKGGDRNR